MKIFSLLCRSFHKFVAIKLWIVWPSIKLFTCGSFNFYWFSPPFNQNFHKLQSSRFSEDSTTVVDSDFPTLITNRFSLSRFFRSHNALQIAINSFLTKSSWNSIYFSGQTQKHSPVAVAAESFYWINFTSAAIWFIKMWFQTSDRKLNRTLVIKYWNHIQMVCCLLVVWKSSKRAYVWHSQ